MPLFRRNAEKWAAVEELGQYDLAAFLSDEGLRAYYALEMSVLGGGGSVKVELKIE